ncbi:hypothetical protein XENOCAPTIV_017692, partial [Xenoophorus captivus]
NVDQVARKKENNIIKSRVQYMLPADVSNYLAIKVLRSGQLGWFLLSSALHQSQHSVAQVVSEWIQLKDTPSCLTFWYHMGTRMDFILLFSFLADFLRKCNDFVISLLLLLYASTFCERNSSLLIENETRGFVSCSFENGTCDWEDISVGQAEWVRTRNGTGNSGPSVDNTLGTELGKALGLQSG